MAYDDDLAARVRDCVQEETGLSEQKMFGGLAFLINGHMAVAASGQRFFRRGLPEQLSEDHDIGVLDIACSPTPLLADPATVPKIS